MAPDIPWPKIIGMRNVLVHGYFEIDAAIVWEAATRDLPALKPAIERLVGRLEHQEAWPAPGHCLNEVALPVSFASCRPQAAALFLSSRPQRLGPWQASHGRTVLDFPGRSRTLLLMCG